MGRVEMDTRALLEALLDLAERARLEVRVLSPTSAAGDFAPIESSACRVGDRVWVVLVPDDPAASQAEALARALGRYRAGFLEENFIAPGVRNFIGRLTGGGGPD